MQGALETLQKEAKSIGCPLEMTPALDSYGWDGQIRPHYQQMSKIDGRLFERNAAMALQLSRHFYNYFISGQSHAPVKHHENLTFANTFHLDKEEVRGLRLCRWPGRSQVITRHTHINGEELQTKYFLDGAHTKVSLEFCVTWFIHASQADIR